MNEQNNEQNNQPNTFVGSGWEKFYNGNSYISLSLNLTELQQFKEYITTNDNGEKCIKLTLGKRKTRNNDKSPTHYAKVDTWRLEAK